VNNGGARTVHQQKVDSGFLCLMVLKQASEVFDPYLVAYTNAQLLLRTGHGLANRAFRLGHCAQYALRIRKEDLASVGNLWASRGAEKQRYIAKIVFQLMNVTREAGLVCAHASRGAIEMQLFRQRNKIIESS